MDGAAECNSYARQINMADALDIQTKYDPAESGERFQLVYENGTPVVQVVIRTKRVKFRLVDPDGNEMFAAKFDPCRIEFTIRSVNRPKYEAALENFRVRLAHHFPHINAETGADLSISEIEENSAQPQMPDSRRVRLIWPAIRNERRFRTAVMLMKAVKEEMAITAFIPASPYSSLTSAARVRTS